ncbi:MAG TPA: type III pantothenate kinase [Spirochaetota bacterium]|nr:type III pantothenate kinase [Spirochaetota bacterium]HOD15966.1 type III pantothenate kinase [Spirochaetota bacterium]HPG50645.1 type III pantothenate kinase [Spirochaetota bacterium]HPN10996.1 type III pantothenate kinase [Spirochaetota bacterium]
MILGFDIGNTSTTAGIYHVNRTEPERVFRFPTLKQAGPEELAGQVLGGLKDGEAREVTGLAFSSVAPEVNRSYCGMAEREFGVRAYEITCGSRLNFSLRYDDPSQLGTDRIVNAAAAFEEYGGGSIVVDIGTAVTFCVLLEGGVFDGGIIAPGIDTAIRSLSLRASRLPEVPFEKPDRLVARDTVNALKSGFFYGWLSLAEGIIARIEREYGRGFNVILTGGFAGVVTAHLSHANTMDPLLAMKGIKIVYDMNVPGA